jgi:hypothetical protein
MRWVKELSRTPSPAARITAAQLELRLKRGSITHPAKPDRSVKKQVEKPSGSQCEADGADKRERMRYDCQMVEEIATFSDSGVILTRLDVSTIVEHYSSIFCFYYDREGQEEIAT